MPVKNDRRKYMREYMREYRKNSGKPTTRKNRKIIDYVVDKYKYGWRGNGGPVGGITINESKKTSGTTRTNPDYEVNVQVSSGSGKSQKSQNADSGIARKIPTWDPAYVNKKMQEAYADASYKRGRRSPTRVSNKTIHNYFQEKEKAYADKVKAQVNRHKQEEKRSYITGKSTLRKGTNYAQGKIPAALKSYGSNWVTGAKSIGRSAKKLPARVSKKLDNFYKKWLKW